MEPADAVARLLASLRAGEPGALDELFALVYAELRVLAHRQLARSAPAQTLDTTGLVHEVYLKLVDQARAQWQDRAHFFAVSATAMRHILVDRARRRTAEKRGGQALRLPLDDAADLQASLESRPEELLALDAALQGLERLSPRLVRVVDLRFFGGLSVEETAELLDVTARTVKRDWRKARAYLYRELSRGA